VEPDPLTPPRLTPPLFVSALREKIHNRATVKSLLLCGMGPHERVMEGTVLSLRIVTTGAVSLVLAAGSASAQIATTAPGKPLSLLQIYPKNEDAAAVKPHHRARYARRRVARTHVANQTTGATRHTYMEVQPAPEPQQTAATQPAATPRTTTQSAAPTSAAVTAAAATPLATTTPAPANIWPAPNATLPGAEALTPAPPAALAAASNEPTAAANQNEMLTAAYHTVQVTPPSAAQAALPDTVKGTPSNAVSPTDNAADHQHVAANTAGPNDAATTWPVQRVMAVTAEPQNPNPVGSASWIIHVLAALVGAVATGALAWVLINPLPARSYE
jgi:hypothetical protein